MPPRFKSIRCELEAIASGEKAMSVFLIPQEKFMGKENKLIHKMAQDLNLIILYFPMQPKNVNDKIRQSYIFVMRDFDHSRVVAYLYTRQILYEYEWSDGLEILESILLGCNENDIEQWIPLIKNRQLTWSGIDVYFILSAEQLSRSSILGFKCLDLGFQENGIDIFFNKKKLSIKYNADCIIGKEFCIARCSLKRDVFSEIFGNPEDWETSDFPCASVASHNICRLNCGIDGKINIYREGMWR